MKKSILAVLALGLSFSFNAHAKTDLITKISKISCNGGSHSFELIWDSAVSPIGPAKFILDGKETPLGGLRMVFAGNDQTYEVAGLNVAFHSSDRNKKFKRTANLKGQDIEFNCESSETTKFLRQREDSPAAPAQPVDKQGSGAT